MAQAGDASPDVVPDILLSMRKQSEEIARMAIEGVRGTSPSSAESPLFLLRCLEKMKQTKFQHQTRLNTGAPTTEDFSPESMTEERLKVLIKNHKKDVGQVKDLYHNKKLFLERILSWGAIHNELLKKNSESKLINETMEHSMGLCTRLLELQKETQRLEEQLTEVKKKRMQLREASSTIMTQIKTKSEQQTRNLNEIENRNIKTTVDFLQKERNFTILLQDIFQRLILASRVNWAEDPKLRAIVLKLDKDPSKS